MPRCWRSVQHLTYGGSAQGGALLLKRLTDLIDRVVVLAQRNDLLVCGALLGLVGGARFPRGEEFRKFVAAEGMTEHAERAWRIAEALGDLEGGEPFEVESAQSLVLALARRAWLTEEAAAVCYLFRFIDRHESTMSNADSGVKSGCATRCVHSR